MIALFVCLLLPCQDRALEFQFHAADRAPFSGRLHRISDDWSVQIEGADTKPIAGRDFVGMRRLGFAIPSVPSGEQVVLVNGDCLAGSAVKLQNERLIFQPMPSISNGDLRLPLESIAILWLTSRESRPDLPDSFRRTTSARRKRDQVLLRNRDLLEGTVAGLDGRQMELDSNGKKVALDRSKIAAIAFSTELARISKPRGPYAKVVLANGSRITLTNCIGNEQTISGKTLFGTAVAIPCEQILKLDLMQNGVDYLSDLKCKSYVHTPYFGLNWPLALDENVVGHPLRLGGDVYDKGLGVHSAAVVTYELQGKYRSFEAVIGLDDDTGREGAVGVRILLDGKAQDLGTLRMLRGGESPKPLRLNLTGAKEITLFVDFGPRGDVQDHVNWGDARFIK